MLAFIQAHQADLFGFALSAALLFAYQVYLRWRTRRDPASSAFDAYQAVRSAWVQSVMAERRDILAVQTLRNSTMSASFMASTAVLLIIGVLTLSAQGDKLSATWHALSLWGPVGTDMWLLKLLVMLFDLVVAFFSFAMAVRLFHHLGYSVNIPPATGPDSAQPQRVIAELNRAAAFYRIGMRAYYFTVPLLFWLFGVMLLMLSTAALVFFLYHLDRAPRSDADLLG